MNHIKLFIESGLHKLGDVDHMPGPTNHDVSNHKYHDDYKKWKEHADHVNHKHHDDNAEIISSSKESHYEVNGKRFAHWDHEKKVGVVHDKGGKI